MHTPRALHKIYLIIPSGCSKLVCFKHLIVHVS